MVVQKDLEDVEQVLSPRSTTSSARIPAGCAEESDSEAGSSCEDSKGVGHGEGCSVTQDDGDFQVVRHHRERRPRVTQERQQRRRRASARRTAGRVLEVARPTAAIAVAVIAMAGLPVEKVTSTGAKVLEVPRRK